MNNGDMQATSCTIKPSQESIDQCYGLGVLAPEATVHLGLTKRETFAMAAMQGLITLKGADCMDTDITAKQCVRMADALLKELSK